MFVCFFLFNAMVMAFIFLDMFACRKGFLCLADFQWRMLLFANINYRWISCNCQIIQRWTFFYHWPWRVPAKRNAPIDGILSGIYGTNLGAHLLMIQIVKIECSYFQWHILKFYGISSNFTLIGLSHCKTEPWLKI